MRLPSAPFRLCETFLEICKCPQRFSVVFKVVFDARTQAPVIRLAHSRLLHLMSYSLLYTTYVRKILIPACAILEIFELRTFVADGCPNNSPSLTLKCNWNCTKTLLSFFYMLRNQTAQHSNHMAEEKKLAKRLSTFKEFDEATEASCSVV